MSPSRALDDRIAAVARLRAQAPSEEGRAALRAALAAKEGLVGAKAAEVAGAWEDRALVGDLVAAFERLLGAGAKADPGCVAKTAIVDAVGRIGEDPGEGSAAQQVFLPGARYEQWEAVWGGRSDTAGALRAACGAGLASWRHPLAATVLADHLADPEPEVRAAAARSLVVRALPDGAPLVRLRLRIGDEDPRVVGECDRALLALAPDDAVALVAEQLATEDDERFAEAALALGESRLAAACEALTATWDREFDLERRKVLLTALGATRCDEAVAFLLGRVEDEAADLACAAVEVLGRQRGGAGLARRVAEAAARGGEEAVLRTFEREFPSDA